MCDTKGVMLFTLPCDERLNRDYFGDTFTMRIDSGNTDLKSYMGALMSLFVIAILQLFAYLKAETLILKKDVDILSTV